MGRPDQNRRRRVPGRLDLTRARVKVRGGEKTFGNEYIAFAKSSFHSRFSKSPFSKGGL
jgi:hypothetical protein